MASNQSLLRTPEEIAYFAGELRAWAADLQRYLSDPARFGAETGEHLSTQAHLFLKVARDGIPELVSVLRRASVLLNRALRIARAAPQPTKAPLRVLAEFAIELERAALDEVILSREVQELELVPLPFRREPSPRLLASVATARKAAAKRERRLVKARPVLSEINRWIEGRLADNATGKPRGSTAAAETRTRNWLRTQAHRQRPKKALMFGEAKELFGVGRRAFERAWASSAPPEWTQGGRPRSPDEKTPAPKPSHQKPPR